MNWLVNEAAANIVPVGDASTANSLTNELAPCRILVATADNVAVLVILAVNPRVLELTADNVTAVCRIISPFLVASTLIIGVNALVNDSVASAVFITAVDCVN